MVKTMRYEIVGWQGDPREAKQRWMIIADRCREIVNVIWQQWELFHIASGNDIKVQQFAEDQWKFRRKEITEKPKLTVNCMPADLSKHIWKKLSERFPGVHARVRTLLMSVTEQRMKGKDVDGRWNIWCAVLLNRQGRPNSTHDQPIPFDKQNCSPFSLVDGKFTNYALKINLTRLPSEKKNSPSIEDCVQLKARGSGLAIMRRIVAGEYKFCGSSIVYNSSRNKWFALVVYDDKHESNNQDKDGTATLIPSRESPWVLWRGSEYHWFGGRGHYVESVRKRLLTGRWSRQENYRYAGSANKGRGRKRALQGVEKLSEGWKDFVKTCNHRMTAAVVQWCVVNRIARLVYLQPVGDKRMTRFLARAGKVEGREDSTNWDWAQVASMLNYKCKESGIHLEIRKCEASGKMIKQPKPKEYDACLEHVHVA